MKMYANSLTAIITASTLLTMGIPAAIAQSPAVGERVLEEVIVTARKRQESLQETPVAVTHLSASDLRVAQINNIADLSKSVPGLSARDGSKTAGLNIRGVGVRSQNLRTDPGVGVYVDSVYIPRTDTQLVDIIAMESVQVLRGPQGTLFGKNTAGGALLLTTKKPGNTWEGFVRVDAGNLNRLNMRAGISGPLVADRLYGGVIVNSSNEDGYWDDAETGVDYGDSDKQAALLQLRWDASENLSLDFMALLDSQAENAAPASCKLAKSTFLQTLTAPGESRSYSQLCAQSQRLADDHKVLMDRSPLRWKTENRLAGLSINWEIGDLLFKSISGYLGQHGIVRNNDVDASPLFTIQNKAEVARQLEGNNIEADDERREFISQEFQLSGAALDGLLDYTVGAFASRERIDEALEGTSLGPGGFTGFNSGDGSVGVLAPNIAGFRGAQLVDFDNDSRAVFAQGIFHLDEQWQLTLGARYTWEEKQARQLNYVTALTSGATLSREEFDALQNFIQPIDLDPETPQSSGKETWEEFNPALTLSWFVPVNWTDNHALDSGMIYVSASEGFKAGGFTPFGDAFLPFEPETIQTYELGFKLDLLQQLRINGAIFQSQYEDIQVNVTRTIDQTTTINGVTNAARADIRGAELELSYLPVEGLRIDLTGSYIDAEYDRFIDEDISGNAVDRSAEDFAYLPKLTWSLAILYKWQSRLGVITPRLSGYYKDEVFIGLDAAAADSDVAYLDDYTLWNARVAWQPPNMDQLEIALYVNNLNDEDYFGTGVISLAGVGAASLVPGKQRTYGIEAYYRW